ncbi:MAG: hypothetical protein ACREP3_12555 [Candidatus Binatia bacterium]
MEPVAAVVPEAIVGLVQQRHQARANHDWIINFRCSQVACAESNWVDVIDKVAIRIETEK